MFTFNKIREYNENQNAATKQAQSGRPNSSTLVDSEGNTTVMQAIFGVVRQAVAIHLNQKLSAFIKELKKSKGDRDVN